MAKIVRGEKRKPFGTNATPTEKAAVYALLKASAKGTLDFSAPISTLFTTATTTAAESQDATAFLFHPALIRPFPNPTLQKRPLPSLLESRKRKAQKDALTRLLHKQRKVDAAVFARPFSPTTEALTLQTALARHPCLVPDFNPTNATIVQQPTLPSPALPLPKLPGVSASAPATATAPRQRGRRSAAPATAPAAATTVALLSSLYPQA